MIEIQKRRFFIKLYMLNQFPSSLLIEQVIDQRLISCLLKSQRENNYFLLKIFVFPGIQVFSGFPCIKTINKSREVEGKLMIFTLIIKL